MPKFSSASLYHGVDNPSGAFRLGKASSNRTPGVPSAYSQPDGPQGISGRLAFFCACGRHVQVYRLLRRGDVLAAATWRGIVCPGCQREYTVGIVVSEEQP